MAIKRSVIDAACRCTGIPFAACGVTSDETLRVRCEGVDFNSGFRVGGYSEVTQQADLDTHVAEGDRADGTTDAT